MSLYRLSDAELNLAIKLVSNGLKAKSKLPSSVKTLEKYISLDAKLRHDRKQRELMSDMQRSVATDKQKG